MDDKDQTVVIVDDGMDAKKADTLFGERWGTQGVRLKPEHLHALQQGKRLAIDAQGEYVIYLKLEGVSHG